MNMNYLKKIENVYKRISKDIRNTPLIYSNHFSKLLECELYFKCENLQYTHAFKVRGALNKLLSIPHETIQNKTLVTASAGNHGLAVTYAAKRLGLDALIYLPVGTPEIKKKKIIGMGGQVESFGSAWDEANAEAMNKGESPDYLYIHPFDDEDIIDGQATIAYEILNEINDVDIILASIGGGGLISGISKYCNSFNRQVDVFGVETIGADSMFQSINAGHLITLDAITSKADSLGAKKVSERTFNYVRRYVKDLYVIEDKKAEEIQIQLLQIEKMLVELSASSTLAVLLNEFIPNLKGKKVVVLLCGANADIYNLNNIKEYSKN